MPRATDHGGEVRAAPDARHLEQQRAIATLSRSAIAAPAVETLLPQAAALLASVLGTPLVVIGEFTAPGRYFVLRAGVGPIEARIGATIDAANTAITTLDRQSPVLIIGTRTHEPVMLLRGISTQPMVSALMTLVDGVEPAWGFILAGSFQLGVFTPDEIEFMQSIAGVLKQVAQRRELESAALRDAQERFARIFQASPVALAITTIDTGRFIDVNEHWLSLLGYRRDEVIGRTNADLDILPDGVRTEAARRARVLRVVRDAEMRLRTKSGECRDILVSSVPFNLASDATWLSALVDITDRTRAEAERDELLTREQLARTEAEQAFEKLDAVYTITDSVLADSELGDLLPELLKRLRRTLQVDHTSVLLLEEESHALYLRATAGTRDAPIVPIVRIPPGVGMSGRIAAEGRPMIENDYSAVDLTGIEGTTPESVKATARSAMGAPFRIRGKVAGVVAATTVGPRVFTTEDLKLLTLAADRVALAIDRGRLIAKIRSGLDRQRTLSRRLFNAQEEERRRLAVELHDELGQVLTAVKINLETLARTPGTAAPAAMDGMIQTVDEALQRVRDIALDLRPSVLDDLGLPAAMRWYVDRFARAGRLEAHLSIGALPPLDPGLQTACFRVAQEALTNVDRHAKARRVWIDLHVLAGALELGIRDDGIGFDVAAARDRAIHGASVGLLGMQERVALMGGEYDVVTVAAGGTEVRARFPLSEPA